MASLYPTTLFHFTDKEGLYNILTSNFKVSYAREKICGPNSEREFAVPMVSFCDIKMADLKYFVEKDYGNFGIGLTKEWANRNSLNPVMYINQHCDIADRFNNGLASVYQTLGSNSLTTKGYHNLINTYRYMKNYEGDLIRDLKITQKNYRFADEREWRYVPPFEQFDVEPFVAKTNIDTREKKIAYNRKIDHIRLMFQPEDIKYLIVENEDDILELIEHLRNAKVNFTEDTKKRLASRILTLEQIINDF